MKKITATLLLLLFSTIANAQLQNFNLSLSKTDETCQGNGSVSISVANKTPNSTMFYKVYLLPDVNNTFALLTQPTVSNLAAGTYKVVAIQSLGAQTNTKEATITLNNLIEPFNFTLSSSNQNCLSGGTIKVTTTEGTFESCQIISGPVTRPMQTSNIFNDLPSGTYNVRAFNDCGIGKVKTYTLYTLNSVLNISDPTFPDLVSPLCDSIRVNNVITSSAGPINYPLTVQHRLNAMTLAGDEIVINQTFLTGSPDSQLLSVVMPRYITEAYTYDITVSDNCNQVYEKLNNEVDPSVILSLSQLDAPCAEKYLKLTVSKYTGSYTVQFLDAPAGFNPADFNAANGGPFTAGSVVYGSPTNPVPFGNYEVKITDSCGRTTTESLLIEFIKPTPNGIGFNNGCFSLFGHLELSVPQQLVVQATITGFPELYTGPTDVNSFINAQGILNLTDMPLGDYTISFTDDCGFTYVQTVVVPPYSPQEFILDAIPSCGPGIGTVVYISGNGALTEVIVTDAPAAFKDNHTLPLNVTENLADGYFYMADLPEGTYTFKGTDICGVEKYKDVVVVGYNAPQNPYTYIANCGGFSINMHDDSNGQAGGSYWLQKYFPETNTWGHPVSGAVYNFDDVPNEGNSLRLYNNNENNNLNYLGKFRIVKKFEAFTTASRGSTLCVSILGQFNYVDELKINTAYTLACVGKPNDVLLEVTGQPVSYKIIQKNGEAFNFDNGTSNIFENIEPAEYVFSVEDACGNVVSQWFNVQTLPSIADATQPKDMVLCVEQANGTTGEFTLTSQNTDILGPLHSAMYTITYHLTYQDADNGENALPELYTNITNGQTIYVRLVHNEISLCHGITSFKLYIGEYQEPQIITTGTICNDGKLTLTVNRAYDTYLWSTGETTRSIEVRDAGMYTVIVEKAYGTSFCDGFAELEIKESFTPQIEKIETEDWTDDNNTITVNTASEGDYQYSVDGITFQDENVFTGLGTGKFTIYVKDKNGCGMDIKEVVLLNYPRFFTPNGDGVHDTWYIKYAVLEPHFKVRITDRYGKLITSFGSTSTGWDGNLNGLQLPSTDYWFVVTREDGRELTGHFSMIR
jgi:gliding motility-associated-like protein